MNADELGSSVDEIRALFKRIPDESGQVFYSGRQTLEGKNGFYLMGLNPGGDPCDPDLKSKTIEKSLAGWLGKAPGWSEYLDEYWGKKKSDPKYEKPGNSRHQKRVMSFCTNCLDEPVRNVFSANAIFKRTRKGDHLPKGTSLEHVCWRVHQQLFLKVRPKYIICLGQGPDSSFDRLKSEKCLAVADSCEKALKMPKGTRNFYIRWFEAAKIQNPLPGLERLVRVIGVPHPSWFDLSAEWFRDEWKKLSPLDANPLKCEKYE
ncbi:MAG: hypothetical protein GDA68_07390 [Nitrospira sp. CR2.1]|nr:hypothetical protein [Nitrospira sp. CR2.1]